MPKEAVHGLRHLTDGLSGEPMSLDEYERDQPVAVVRWGRDEGHVQVVTRLKGYEVAVDDPIRFEYGMHVDLDRRGINEFIRALRRARDQACGRDE